jgi:ABC-type Fe3+/spermidine/putrescine transport system ATPase subunit
MPGISVKGLSKKFGSFPAVSEVSFLIPEGGFCTLLGPSGCGKSTTLRLIAGLEKPDAGSISIGDVIVSGPGMFMPPERRRLGYVFQSYALWPHMKAVDQVAYPLRTQGVRREDIPRMVAEALDVVGLSAETHRYPSELSGGQQQRVALARALVFRPSVLLLDEPLSNLDAELRAQLRAELHELRSRINVTTIHVTHDQHEALSLSDSVVVMDRGRVVEIGTPEEIYARPKKLHTATFVGAGNTLQGEVVGVEADGRLDVKLGDGTQIKGRCSSTMAAGDRVVVLFRPEDVTLWQGEGSSDNQLNGTVVGRMYYGAYSLLTVNAAGTELRVQADKSQHVEPGDEVGLDLSASNVMVFPLDANQQPRANAPVRNREKETAPVKGGLLQNNSGAMEAAT